MKGPRFETAMTPQRARHSHWLCGIRARGSSQSLLLPRSSALEFDKKLVAIEVEHEKPNGG